MQLRLQISFFLLDSIHFVFFLSNFGGGYLQFFNFDFILARVFLDQLEDILVALALLLGERRAAVLRIALENLD